MKIGILGYGNLGKGVEVNLRDHADMELAAVFTRRPVGEISLQTEGVPLLPYTELKAGSKGIDVLILCGGSATDLPEMSPAAAGCCHIVDSFDNHGQIPEHFRRVDEAARAAGTLAVISAGWDPGLFSLARLYASAVLPSGKSHTFWGKGISQGHSDAVRRIPGVRDARQYTIPLPEALERLREGSQIELSAREKHRRECFVLAEEGADRAAIEQSIKNMPGYFADYDTTVHFVSEEELRRDHGGMPHGGRVIHSGRSGREGEHSHSLEFALRLDSNPEFTSSVLIACARAAYRLGQAGQSGCRTLFDLPPALLSPRDGAELRRDLL